jgi:hypothetical protein
MSFRTLQKKASVVAKSVAAAPARTASFLRKEFRTTQDIESQHTVQTIEVETAATIAARAVASLNDAASQNTVETLPMTKFTNGTIAPANWKLLSAQERHAIFSQQLESVEAAGVEVKTNAARPLVGDAAKIALRRESISERQQLLNMDPLRSNLTPQHRKSPLWQDVDHARQRQPRVPLAADTGVNISPTAGLLHLYRIHHAKMFLHQEERRAALEKTREYVDLDSVDLTLEPIEGADNAQMARLMEFIRHYMRRRTSVAPSEQARLLLTIKELLPKVVHIERVVEVKRKRRRN